MFAKPLELTDRIGKSRGERRDVTILSRSADRLAGWTTLREPSSRFGDQPGAKFCQAVVTEALDPPTELTTALPWSPSERAGTRSERLGGDQFGEGMSVRLVPMEKAIPPDVDFGLLGAAFGVGLPLEGSGDGRSTFEPDHDPVVGLAVCGGSRLDRRHGVISQTTVPWVCHTPKRSTACNPGIALKL